MPKTLLLADDSLTIRRVVELTFADEDVVVTTVGDGQRAMARIASLRPDIVLADAAMSAPDGYDVAAFVKGTPELAHIPVILLTAAFQPIDEVRAKAAGCEAVLAKPFELTLLVARVKELLRAAEVQPRASAGVKQAGEADRPEAPAPGGTAVSLARDHSLEDLFDAIDQSCSTPGNSGLPLLDARLLPLLPAWDGSPAPGDALSIDGYFDLVDEATRGGQDPAEAGGVRHPLSAGTAGNSPPPPAAPIILPAPEPATTPADGEAVPGVDSVAAIFLSLLQSSVVPASPQHVERALRRLLGDA